MGCYRLILFIFLFTTELAIIVFFFLEYLPADDRKRPKHVGGLPYVCISLYLIILQSLEYIR
jgi:hypothetical protein